MWFERLGDSLLSSSSSFGPVPVAYSVLMWILTVLFYVLFCVLFLRVIQLIVREKRCGFSVNLSVHCLLIIPTVARAVDMTLFHDGYLITPFQDQTTAEMIIGSVPGYTFFSTYSLLFCFWIILNQQDPSAQAVGSKSDKKKHLVLMYSLVNISIYCIWIVFEVVIACLKGDKRTKFHMGEVFFASVVNIVSAIIFWISGYCAYTRVRRLADSQKSIPPGRPSVNTLPRSNKGMEIAQKVFRLTLIFTSVLAFRSVIIIADWFVPVEKNSHSLLVTFTLRVLFQAVCELVPTILTITVLAKAVDTDPSKQPLIKSRESSSSSLPA